MILFTCNICTYALKMLPNQYAINGGCFSLYYKTAPFQYVTRGTQKESFTSNVFLISFGYYPTHDKMVMKLF